ncbi:MAG: hypothetical protein LBD92_02150 [Oscillospiraceae bacterium]|jgi:ATP phosphoribosyltransferase regulatory subunit HisZ|nr:hypothetical protein [Oscillospiraceae bacterium]
MIYEAFYDDILSVAEELKEQLSSQQKLVKRLMKCVGNGDLKAAARELPAANAAADVCARSIASITEKIEAADMFAYLRSGDFARQLVNMCREYGIDIKGEGNSYEVFPYRLKIDPQNAELQINGKKALGLRPRAVVEDLQKKRAHLLSASFNPAQYAAELSSAYDLALLAASKGKAYAPDADVHLTTLHRYLTPMRRFRRDYDPQSFAFDIARLYDAETDAPVVIGDGRRVHFGPGRDNSKAIRILDALGSERFLSTVRFYRP